MRGTLEREAGAGVDDHWPQHLIFREAGMEGGEKKNLARGGNAISN